MLSALSKLRWYLRLPIKWTLFGLTIIAVCFPYPARLASHLRHWRDPNALIEPNAAVIRPLVEELRPRLAGDLPSQEVLSRVERFVYEKVPYQWDWKTWGTADYLPTVDEVFEAGKEDCDGRAVVAASILQNLGYKTELVTDFAHVWVKTDRGETMAPGRRKTLTATDKGLQVDVKALTTLPRSLAYGIAVFPMVRELIVLFVLWLLLLRPACRPVAGWGGAVLFLVGLVLFRFGSNDYQHPRVWVQGIALAGWLSAVMILYFSGRPRTRNVTRIDTPAATSGESNEAV